MLGSTLISSVLDSCRKFWYRKVDSLETPLMQGHTSNVAENHELQATSDVNSITVSESWTSIRERNLKSDKIAEPKKKYLHNEFKFPFVDIVGRSAEIPPQDSYISPSNGKLRELVVQCTEEEFRSSSGATWARRRWENVTPLTLRVISGACNERNPFLFLVKWMWAMLILILTMTYFPFISKDAKIRWGGRYAPFAYKYHGYPKASRNYLEEKPIDDRVKLMTTHVSYHDRLQRRHRPRKLNVAKPVIINGQKLLRYEATDMAKWKEEKNTVVDPDYIFISYTREQFPHGYENRLDRLAQKACREAGVFAYWSDNCTKDENNSCDPNELLRIADYVRQAHGVVIIRGPSRSDQDQNANANREYSDEQLKIMLQIWGRRVWTFPEILLAQVDRARVYTDGLGDDNEKAVQNIPKTQIADIAWHDYPHSGDLVNHIRGTMPLSRLELVSIALKCFHERTLETHSRGDRANALAGLLRIRPLADEADSEFQAFARLSLANDNDQILERMLCMLPSTSNESWEKLDDEWGVPIWEIEPKVQISAIGDDDTVIIDGARGASVRWKSFAAVVTMRKQSLRRELANICLPLPSFMLIVGIVLLIYYQITANQGSNAGNNSPADQRSNAFNNSISTAYYSIIGVASGILLTYPALVRFQYSGKPYDHQPWLFGIEGYAKIDDIEQRIWNESKGWLKWSAFGSPLSVHREVKIKGKSDNTAAQETTHVEGFDPMDEPRMVEKIGEAKNKGYRLFTLVDTKTMTTFLFLSKRPPVAFLVCGHEGGMQRAIGVSFDFTTETVYRETVLRMETTVLDAMSRVPRCRIGIRRDETKEIWKTIPEPTDEKDGLASWIGKLLKLGKGRDESEV